MTHSHTSGDSMSNEELCEAIQEAWAIVHRTGSGVPTYQVAAELFKSLCHEQARRAAERRQHD